MCGEVGIYEGLTLLEGQYLLAVRIPVHFFQDQSRKQVHIKFDRTIRHQVCDHLMSI